MARHGENIYKRKDGRYEGRYVIGKKCDGSTRFGYIYGSRYIEVKMRLLEKKAEIQRAAHPEATAHGITIENGCGIGWRRMCGERSRLPPTWRTRIS